MKRRPMMRWWFLVALAGVSGVQAADIQYDHTRIYHQPDNNITLMALTSTSLFFSRKGEEGCPGGKGIYRYQPGKEAKLLGSFDCVVSLQVLQGQVLAEVWDEKKRETFLTSFAEGKDQTVQIMDEKALFPGLAGLREQHKLAYDYVAETMNLSDANSPELKHGEVVRKIWDPYTRQLHLIMRGKPSITELKDLFLMTSVQIGTREAPVKMNPRIRPLPMKGVTDARHWLFPTPRAQADKSPRPLCFGVARTNLEGKPRLTCISGDDVLKVAIIRNAGDTSVNADDITIENPGIPGFNALGMAGNGDLLVYDRTETPGARRTLQWVELQPRTVKALTLTARDVYAVTGAGDRGVLVSRSTGVDLYTPKGGDPILSEGSAGAWTEASLQRIESVKSGGSSRPLRVQKLENQFVIMANVLPEGKKADTEWESISVGRADTFNSYVFSPDHKVLYFLSMNFTPTLIQDHASFRLVKDDIDGTNLPAALKLAEKGKDFSGIDPIGNVITAGAKSPSLFVLEGTTLLLARRPLRGSHFKSLVESKEGVVVKVVRPDGQTPYDYDIQVRPANRQRIEVVMASSEAEGKEETNK